PGPRARPSARARGRRAPPARATASSRPILRTSAAGRRTVRSSSPPPDSGSRTPGSRRRSRRRRRLPRQDVGEPVKVVLVEDAPAPAPLQADDELGAEDVDLAVEQAALVADLPLLLLEVVDEGLQLLVGQ